MRYNTTLRVGKEMLSSSWACSSTVEQGTHNPLVLGSNPGGPTKFPGQRLMLLAFFISIVSMGKLWAKLFMNVL
mgnify:CR=1 FL=1